VPTWSLNLWLKDMLVAQAPARHAGKPIALKYMTQVKARPPTFALFCNVATLPGFYERFLRSKLQRDFKLEGVPVRFVVRKSKGTAVNKMLLKDTYKVKGVGDQGTGRRRARRGAGNESARPVGKKRDDPDAMRQLRMKRDHRRRKESRMRGVVARNSR
jgi:hypothetical protein